MKIKFKLYGRGYLLPFYMSVAAGYSALLSGILLFIPAGITAVLGGYIGKLSDVRGRRVFVLLSLVFLLAKASIFILHPPSQFG